MSEAADSIRDQWDRAPLFALLTANAISELGNILALTTIPWFVLQTTGSAARTGIATFFTTLPFVLAGIFGGPLVDLFGFKLVSIAADVASGVTIALIPLLYETIGIAFWQLAILLFLSTSLDTPGGTARFGLLPDLVNAADVSVERANAAYQGPRRLALFLAPVLAGILIATLGASLVLLLDAATYAVSALLISFLVPSMATKTAGSVSNGGYFAQLGAGFRVLREDRPLQVLVTATAIINGILNALVIVVIPVYADVAFRTAVALGVLITSYGAGTLIGVFGFGWIGGRVSRRITLIAAFVLGGVSFVSVALIHSLFATMGALFVIGISAGFVAPLNALMVQERTPAATRGRIFGLLTAVTTGATPIGLIAVGFLLEKLSLPAVLLVLASMYLLARGMLLFGTASLSVGGREHERLNQ